MNRPVIAVVFLITAIAVSIASLVYIEISCDNVIETLNTAIEYSSKEDYENVGKELNIAVEKWEKSKHLLNIIIGQQETTEIRNDLNKSIFFYNIKNYESMILYIEDCKMDLNKIIVTNEPMI